MVVKLLMKMEESVDSSKQPPVKDGEEIYSAYEKQHFFSSDGLSFNEELTYLGGRRVIQDKSIRKHIECGPNCENWGIGCVNLCVHVV